MLGMNTVAAFLIFIWILLDLRCFSFPKEKVAIVKDVRGKYHILYQAYKKSRLLADEKAVVFLGFNLSSISVMRDDELSMFVDEFKVPILSDADKKTSLMKHIVRITALSPTYFWKQLHMIPKILNPSISRWQGRILAAWRLGVYHQPIHFGWLEWNENDREYEIDSTPHMGVGDDSVINVQNVGFNKLSEDPRLISKSDGAMMVSYTSKKNLRSPPQETVLHLLPPLYYGYIPGIGKLTNKNDVNVSVTKSILLEGQSFGCYGTIWCIQSYWNDGNNSQWLYSIIAMESGLRTAYSRRYPNFVSG